VIPEPLPVRGGTVWCDLAGEDRGVLDGLIADARADTIGAAAIAFAAQELGLPVVDFRPRSSWGALPLAHVTPGPDTGRARAAPAKDGHGPLADVRVCDLTAMWAGPLATWVLASLGAEITKVEPECRLDGTRGDPPLFHALNRGKHRADLDLRREVDRGAFMALSARSDLVISNFSPRVPRNLEIRPSDLMAGRSRPVVCVQMPAFPSGTRERDWRAYGHAIHAVSGLGATTAGQPWTAMSPYCDVLSGFAGAAVAVLLHLAAERTGRSWAAEVPMLNVARMLAGLAAAPLAPPRPAGPDAAAACLRARPDLLMPADGFLSPRAPIGVAV
jgi:hypothetical protein